MNNKMPIPVKMEVIFDSLYLVTATGFGLYYLLLGDSQTRILWGIMSLILAVGDSFHLVPRIAMAITGDKDKYQKSMGIGKLLTSITMTLFYLLLWNIGLRVFQLEFPAYTMLIYVLAAVRIVLCLFAQNQWTSKTPSVKWGIYRNIPFVVQGLMVLVLFFQYRATSLQSMWIAILLSFAFYIPVVLWVHKNPKLGMLMLPKTMAYIWIITMGLKM